MTSKTAAVDWDGHEEEKAIVKKFKSMDRVFFESSLDHPTEIEAKSGSMVFGMDLGAFGSDPRTRQEDALVVNTNAESFAVVDGMGGYDRGQEAARTLAEQLRIGFRRRRKFESMQFLAHLKMQQQGLGENGACFFAFRVKEKQLEAGLAGNVQCAIYNTKGRLRFVSEAEGSGDILDNAVQGSRPGSTKCFGMELYHRDRLLVGSDGLWHNVAPDEAGVILADFPTGDAFRALWAEVKQRMQRPDGKVDNISMLLYDFFQPGIFPELPASIRLRQARTVDELLDVVDEVGGLPGMTCIELRRLVLGLRDGRVPSSKIQNLPTALGFRYLVERMLNR